VAVGDLVKVGTVIGKAQDIAARYPEGKMTNHIHFEVKHNGDVLNPVDFLRKQGVQI
jgi:murein DD-endopeptidase MepM/ murein hydrolase activator NlpD